MGRSGNARRVLETDCKARLVVRFFLAEGGERRAEGTRDTNDQVGRCGNARRVLVDDFLARLVVRFFLAEGGEGRGG